ncbi:MAG: hypothetical protein ABEJ89_09780 [Haloarculaceae archaeon]
MAVQSSGSGMADYQPGVCNIGTAERRKRRRVGYAGFAVAVAYVGVVVVAGLPDTALLATVAPLFAGFLGALQDRLRFCAGFAALARYDLSETGGDVHRVTDADAVRRDRRRAVQIVAGAALAAAALTAVLYLAAGLR